MVLICPICKKKVSLTNTPDALQKYVSDIKNNPYHNEINSQEIIESIESTDEIDWSCNECIAEKRSLIANQSKMDGSMHLWFATFNDEERECQNCHKKYLFTKEEKKFWYETLQFSQRSKPILCRECRAKDREKAQLNTSLMQLISKLEEDKINVKILLQISQTYEQMGNIEKATLFRNRAKNVQKRNQVTDAQD